MKNYHKGLKMAFDTSTDVFDTPKTRYYKLKGDVIKSQSLEL